MSTAAESPRDARLDLRLPQETRALLDEAASLAGTNLTDYVLGLVVPAARRDVLEARQIRLSHEAWEDFLDVLDRPDSPELAALRDHTPTWGEPRS
ncbi:type II toxin-antitoxin system TacA family antitoxin [Acidipropionibacterium acidipropionici]|uniref:type II toxin-antitoxin system TacA family antitoxin n=1 Tax=Acidipropionibacterium acidipropionici TaxID=1748 RepID=UPI001586DB9B|nr:DUF1778 domain-containing protein [Acidipropionibacterium acidipropionici]